MGAVVITGLVIVFVALALLILAVWLMGRIFAALRPKSGGETGGGNSPAEARKTAAEKDTPETPSGVPVPDEEEGEIIAVIAAAVAAMAAESGTPLRIKRITPAGGSQGRRNPWSAAAARENTSVF